MKRSPKVTASSSTGSTVVTGGEIATMGRMKGIAETGQQQLHHQTNVSAQNYYIESTIMSKTVHYIYIPITDIQKSQTSSEAKEAFRNITLIG